MIKSFLDLEVYQESFQLSLEVDDRVIPQFPKHEKYLLADQCRRASRGIPSLIAEGYAKRDSLKTFQKFLKDAVGEANEMINHLSFAKAKGYLDPAYADQLIDRYHILGKKLTRLRENWKKY